MDLSVLEWTEKNPKDWSEISVSHVYTWGSGACGQLGHSLGEEMASPALVSDWQDVYQVSIGCISGQKSLSAITHCAGLDTSIKGQELYTHH